MLEKFSNQACALSTIILTPIFLQCSAIQQQRQGTNNTS